MKTLFKILLFLALCFAVMSERNLGFQVDSIGVAVQSNLAPYIKITLGEFYYLMNIQSIYEIYQDSNTNQWTKDYTTETKLDSLTWKTTADLLKGYAALTGTPCPCQNPQHPQDVEPFQVTRNVGRTVRDDPFENLVCAPVNFGYLRLVFQNVAGQNNSECAVVDVGTCTTRCNEACANATNPINCNTGCSAITSASIIDTNACYTACNITGAEDPDCLNGCMNMVDCITQTSCRLDIGYHLHNYTWANSTTNPGARKLVFAFEIIPEPAQECGVEVVTWFKGPFFLWINTTSLAVQHQDNCEDCLPDVSAATLVPSNLFFAPGESSVTGRVYVDQFASGLSVFNEPPEAINMPPAAPAR